MALKATGGATAKQSGTGFRHASKYPLDICRLVWSNSALKTSKTYLSCPLTSLNRASPFLQQAAYLRRPLRLTSVPMPREITEHLLPSFILSVAFLPRCHNCNPN